MTTELTDEQIKAVFVQMHTADNSWPEFARAIIKADRAQRQAEPYAYAVYFPDQPTEELVHDLDALADDLTNRHHTITSLYTAPPAAPAPEGWISVDERLPEVGVAVLGLIRSAVGVYMRDDGGGDGWLWAQQQNYWDLHGEGFACDDDYEVTHWQALAAAPDCP